MPNIQTYQVYPTFFDSTKTDKTMAVIDTPSTPGYLTLKTI